MALINVKDAMWIIHKTGYGITFDWDWNILLWSILPKSSRGSEKFAEKLIF